MTYKQMSGSCTCDLGMAPIVKLSRNMTPSPVLKSQKKGVFSLEASDITKNILGDNSGGCQTGGPASFGANFFNALTMGLFPAPEPDTNELKDLQSKNDQLKEAFTDCKFTMLNCQMNQQLDMVKNQIQMTKTLQEITDNAQDQRIRKNFSMAYFAIGMSFIMMTYLLAMPTSKAPQGVF